MFKKINFWIEGDISTTRVVSRLLNDVAGSGNCRTRLIKQIDWESLVDGVNIFCRTCDPDYNWLPEYMRKRNIPYVYYLDDNFWKITGSGELARYYHSADVVNTLDTFVKGSIFVITHNKLLADFIGFRFPSVICKLLPVPFDVALVKSLVGNHPRLANQNKVVGYAGGYKKDEFELLEKVIGKLSVERPDIRFEFIGGISDGLRESDNVQWFPGFSDYSSFLDFKISRNWKIGLAPLIHSAFNASKTNNKFREYGGCGIPGIYSNTSPFTECIQTDKSGLLVDNDVLDWVDAIKRLIDDQLLQQKIKQEAFKFVEENYSHSSMIPVWRDAFSEVSKGSRLLQIDRIRFNFVKHYYLGRYPEVAKTIDDAESRTMLLLIFKRKWKSLISRVLR